MGKQYSRIAPLKWIFLNLISDDKGLKDDRKGGKKGKEGRIGEEDYGRGTRTQEHRGKSTHETKLFIKIQLTFSLTDICLLKRERRCGSEGMRRDSCTRRRNAISRYFPSSVRGFVNGP